MAVNIEIKNQQKSIAINPPRIKRIVRSILRNEGVSAAALSIAFVTDRKIKSLNKQFLGRDHATDVLAFDLKDARPLIQSKKATRLDGEIIISCATARGNAQRYSTSAHYELMLYVVHGILHLLGYDDHAKQDQFKMRLKEKEVLEKLKLVI